MAAAGVRQYIWPEHFFAASPLDQQFPALIAEYVHRERFVEHTPPGVGFESIGRAGLFSLLVDEDYPGHGWPFYHLEYIRKLSPQSRGSSEPGLSCWTIL